MTNILITGGDGQLASCIKEILPEFKNYRATFANRRELDISNQEEISSFLDEHNFDVIVNCAAYTNVDGAETNFDNAYLINALGPKNLFIECERRKIRLIHISTDFVCPKDTFYPFDSEIVDIDSIPNVYGKTKYQGEEFIRKIANEKDYYHYLIIRTSWLYSEYSKNFTKTIFGRLVSDECCEVVDDQIGTPTYGIDLARFILEIIPYYTIRKVLCYSNTGVASWFDFAKEIENCINAKKSNIIPCSSPNFPNIAKRQNFSVMNKRETESVIEHFKLSKIPYWRDSLDICVNNLLSIYNEKGEE